MCGVGSQNHIHHYQPNRGDLAVLKQHTFQLLLASLSQMDLTAGVLIVAHSIF
jgi:hypothetical protein